MKVEWRCASTISGGQCVITTGTGLMQLWFANSWDMHTLEVSESDIVLQDSLVIIKNTLSVVQVELHITMLSLELVLDPST